MKSLFEGSRPGRSGRRLVGAMVGWAAVLALGQGAAWAAGKAAAPSAPSAPASGAASTSATAAALPAPATAESTAITAQPWTEKTWAVLRDKGPRPAAYLFTASYCSTCPEAFSALREATKDRPRPVELAAVWMDLDAHQARQHAAHFQGVTRLYAFDGFEPAIRQSVDPQWANVTPYVVLVDRHGRLQRMLGTPPATALKRWLE